MDLFTFTRKNMHKKTMILHYIAHNPGLRGKQISEDLGIKMGTVRTYLNYLYEEKKISKAGSFGWKLHKSVDINSIPEPPRTVKDKQPWEYLQEAMRNLTGTLTGDTYVQE